MGTGSLSLLDYRRRVAELYAAVRASPDPRAGHDLWRRGRDALYADHPDSPLAADDARRSAGLPVAPYDPQLRVMAALRPHPEDADPEDADPEGAPHPSRLRVTTGTDGTVEFTRLGVLDTPWGPLDAWWLTGYGGGLWVPVRDAGCGSLSYGGGRYLLDTVKGADLGGSGTGSAGTSSAAPGVVELVVDLNFLYNPSCAYDPAWACPLAPPGNRLDAVIAAGELAG